EEQFSGNERSYQRSAVNGHSDRKESLEFSSETAGMTLQTVRDVLAQDSELPLSIIRDDSRLGKDLHISLIKVGQIVAKVARQLGLPPPLALTDYANSTPVDIAEAFENIKQTNGQAFGDHGGRFPTGVSSWVRAF